MGGDGEIATFNHRHPIDVREIHKFNLKIPYFGSLALLNFNRFLLCGGGLLQGKRGKIDVLAQKIHQVGMTHEPFRELAVVHHRRHRMPATVSFEINTECIFLLVNRGVADIRHGISKSFDRLVSLKRDSFLLIVPFRGNKSQTKKSKTDMSDRTPDELWISHIDGIPNLRVGNEREHCTEGKKENQDFFRRKYGHEDGSKSCNDERRQHAAQNRPAL